MICSSSASFSAMHEVEAISPFDSTLILHVCRVDRSHPYFLKKILVKKCDQSKSMNSKYSFNCLDVPVTDYIKGAQSAARKVIAARPRSFSGILPF